MLVHHGLTCREPRLVSQAGATMQTINIHDAKTHFSKLLEQVQNGEEIVIARAGHPIAKLIAWQESPQRIAAPGGMADPKFWIADNFDESIDELFES